MVAAVRVTVEFRGKEVVTKQGNLMLYKASDTHEGPWDAHTHDGNVVVM